MEPRNPEGAADRPRSAGGKESGRVIVIGPYLRMRRGDPDASTDSYAIRNSEARLEEAKQEVDAWLTSNAQAPGTLAPMLETWEQRFKLMEVG